MSEKDQIIEKLRILLPNFPIKKAWLFGSYVNGTPTVDSDVDLLVTYEKDDRFSVFTIGGIISELSEKLGKTVDLVESGRILPFAQKSIETSKILIYERNA